ncbi:hypothetical protein AArcS_2725 [Natranaeroarchaeum sulfidigenes]|uniref:Uncharacterized protein n=1 Tax=Natranaeroarchaeum sulfidigenes TaxID=2784880 RepID=A0A897MUE6_9EURY|nr:hypothetical protein AArcS_2725 [Natranaeroarchaeum sulfidigenes]
MPGFIYFRLFPECMMSIKQKAIALGVIVVMNTVVFFLFGLLAVISFVASAPLAFAILKR